MPCNVKCLGGSFLEFFWSHMLLTLQVTLSNKLIMAKKIALLSKKVTSVKKALHLFTNLLLQPTIKLRDEMQ
jgi:hypothetical protein